MSCAGDVPHIIANVLEAFVPHGADQIVCLVHAIAGRIDVLPWLGLLTAQEGTALDVRRDLHAGQGEHRRREVYERDQVVVDGSGSNGVGLVRHGELAPLRRNANQQRDLKTRIVDPALCPWEPSPVISPEPYDRIVGQTILFQLVEHLLNLLIHQRDDVIVLRPILANLGRVGIVRWQLGLGRVVPLRRTQTRQAFHHRIAAVANLAFVGERKVDH